MTEQTRQQIVARWRTGASIRAIARIVGVSRKTVRRVINAVETERTEGRDALPQPPSRRSSKLDLHAQLIGELLARYPDITAARVHQELQSRGYVGGYTMVRAKVRELRPAPSLTPVVRFETAPGAQAQMDYSSHTLDFTAEGRRRVHLFSYILGYSRRQYLRFVACQDFATTVREHIRAFAHLGGVAATCLYDNMKVVVSGFDGCEPIYNPHFLAFATHYGFTPWACKPRHPETKGKVERPFFYAETSLLNGRTFRSLEHLNDVTAWWLAHVADVHQHRTTGQRPIDRHAEELPHLIPLPTRPYDPAPVEYRVVDSEGLVSWKGNRYSVPWRYIGQTLPVRITESELVVYSPAIKEIARHSLVGNDQTRQKKVQPEHVPRRDGHERMAVLRERYQELGEVALRFLDGLLASRRYGKDEALKVLALLGTYAKTDLLHALQRAVQYRAFSLRAVERILAVTAKPKGLLDMLADDVREQLGRLHPDPPVPPRPTSEYQFLLDEENADGQAPHIPEDPTDAQDADQDGGAAPQDP